jgi:hypothetical protein
VACNSYVWNGVTHTISANPTHVYTNVAGCDSLHTLHLTINYSNSATLNVTAYGCYTWIANGQSYPSSGVYVATLTNMVNCDSVVTLNLTVIQGITIRAKLILAGPYNTATGLMNDSLRVKGLLPLTDLYSSAPYLSGGVPRTTTSAVLAVSGANAIVDWVYVQLRSVVNPAIIVATQKALLQRDGDVVSYLDGTSVVYFSGVAAGNYYVSIKHRNHLGVMTPTSVPVNSCSSLIDFTTGSVWIKNDVASMVNPPRKTIGTNLYALWGGDANLNKSVRANGLNNDKNVVLTALSNNANGVISNVYRIEDLNMDGKIQYSGTTVSEFFNVISATVGASTPNNTVYQHTPN